MPKSAWPSAILSSIADLPQSSPYWSHVQDNIANALAALGRTPEAVSHYESAISGWHNDRDRARSLDNLGMSYIAVPRWDDASDCFNKALDLLSSDRASPAWARVKGHAGLIILQRVLATSYSDGAEKQLAQAINDFETARDILRDHSPLEWASITTHLAAALVRRGIYRATRGPVAKPQADGAGIEDIRASLSLYLEAAPHLLTLAPDELVNNIGISLSILAQLSPVPATIFNIALYKYDIGIALDQHAGAGAFYAKSPP